MAFFRLIAVIFISAGLMAVGYDVISSLQAGTGFKVISLDALWRLVHAGSIDGLYAWSAQTGGGTAENVVRTIASWPAFAVFGVIGVVLGLLFQKRSRYDD